MSTKVLLKDLIKEDRRITYGVVKPGPEDESGVTLVRGGDIKAGKVQLDGLRTITEEVSRSYRRTLLRGGELLISLVGNPGEVAIASDTLKDANIARQVGLVPLDKSVNSKYVMYYLMSPQGRSQLFMRTQGAVQQVINLADIKKVPIPIITRKDQDRIASILSAYDDLIENNRRRIALLEEAARQLYKEWFVRFRYPGHEHVPIVDGVPEGWEKKEVADVVNFQGGFAFKSKSYLETGKYGIVTIKNVHDGQFIPDCTAFLDKIPSKVKPYCKLSSGDILMSLTGNIGRVCLVVGDNYLLNQRVTKIDPVSGYRTFAYFTFRSKDMQIRLKNLSHGAAQQNLSPINTGKLSIVVPVSPLLAQFEDFGGPVLKQIVVLNHANQQLAKARDLLLPKLMNGEIAV